MDNYKINKELKEAICGEILSEEFIKDICRVSYEPENIKPNEWEELYKKHNSSEFHHLLIKTPETPIEIVEQILNDTTEESYYRQSILLAAARREDITVDIFRQICLSLGKTKIENELADTLAFRSKTKPDAVPFSDKFIDLLIEKYALTFTLAFAFCKNESVVKSYFEQNPDDEELAFAITNNVHMPEGMRNSAFEIQISDPLNIPFKTEYVKSLNDNILINSLYFPESNHKEILKKIFNLHITERPSDETVINLLTALETSNMFKKEPSETQLLFALLSEYNNSKEVLLKGYDALKQHHEFGSIPAFGKYFQNPNFPSEVIYNELNNEINKFSHSINEQNYSDNLVDAFLTKTFQIISNIEKYNLTQEDKHSLYKKIAKCHNIGLDIALATNENLPEDILKIVISNQKYYLSENDIEQIDNGEARNSDSQPYDIAKINLMLGKFVPPNAANQFHNLLSVCKSLNIEDAKNFKISSRYIFVVKNEDDFKNFLSIYPKVKEQLSTEFTKDLFANYVENVIKKTENYFSKTNTKLYNIKEYEEKYVLIKPEIAKELSIEELKESLKPLSSTALKNIQKDIIEIAGNPATIYDNHKQIICNAIKTALHIQAYSNVYEAIETVLQNKRHRKSPVKNHEEQGR